MAGHKYGGKHTSLKLYVLEQYLDFYSKALNKIFHLHYIDGFAGTGERTVIKPASPLLGEEEEEISIDGSAKIALGINPPFNQFVFIESKANRIQALKELKASHDDKNIQLFEGDANQHIKKYCSSTAWRGSNTIGKGQRGVIFLDPYGLQVDWETLAEIAKTGAIDVVFMFSIEGVVRQTPHDKEKLDSYKEACLTRVLGTDRWKTEAYAKSPQFSLLDNHEPEIRVSDTKRLEQSVKDRLCEIFPYVSEPVPLPRSGGPQKFSLFFAISNDGDKAIRLASKVIKHIREHI